jgi:hypothetical protein
MKKLILSLLILSLVSIVSITGLEASAQDGSITLALTSEAGERDLGLVAEEVAKVEPLLVTHNERGEIEGVKYDRIAVVLINAIRQQQEQMERQKAENDKLKQQLKQQEERLLRLEAAMDAMREGKKN